MSDANRTILRRLAETTWNQIPSAAMTETRFTSESLAFNVGFIASQEITPTRDTSDLIQVGADSSGDVNFELIYGEYDELLESAFYNAFSTTFNVTDTDIDAANADNSFNKTGADFPTTLVPGQFIYVSGFTETANNGWHEVVTATASKITVSSTLTTEAAGDSVTIKSSHLRNGVTRKSFTLEKEFADKTQFFSFSGMVVNTMSLSFAANQIATGTFSFLGGAAARAGATVGTGAANAATTNTPMNGVSNLSNIKEAGSPLSGIFFQSVDLNINNNVRPIDAIGTLGHIDVGAGTIEVTGTINAYFEDGNLYDKYVAGTETSVSFEMTDADGNRYLVNMPRVKFSSGAPTAGGLNQDVLLPLGFQAIKDQTFGHSVQIDRAPAA